MPITKPTSAQYHRKRDTTTLHFKDGHAEECLMRGGLCWPTLIHLGNREQIVGYALVVGVNISTGVATIYEETPWTSVDHITDAEGKIKYKGLAPWLNNCWTTYYCRKFYWRDSSATYGRYMRDIKRSAMVQPKPSLPQVIWDEDAEVSHVMSVMALEGKLVVDKDGGFFEQQQSYLTNPSQFYPARYALMCCVAGVDQYRWKRGDQDYD